MAYAAAACLRNTIERILSYPHYILVPPSRETIQLALAVAVSLMALLRELDHTSKGRSRKSVNALDEEIRDTVSKFEDVLESRVTDQLLSQSDQIRSGDAGIQFSIDLLDLKQNVHSFTKRVRKLKRAFKEALNNMCGEEDDGVVSSVTGFGGINSNMLGLSDQFRTAKAWVVDESHPNQWDVVLLGMGGIGKTALAKKIFEDPDVKSHFYHLLWVTVGRKYRREEILRVIVAQLNPSNKQILEKGEDDMAEYLKESLKGRRFLIVVDDVWVREDWRDVVLQIALDVKNGSRVLLTSRLHREASDSPLRLEVRFLNKEESWELLREKVFGKESCPPPLEKAGKKIAENCDGLPLTILTIARLLSKAEMTPEYWDEVAEERNSVFTDAYNEISKVLYPSYDYLPQPLKMCFLSAGVFPKKTVIPRSKLVNMWGVEDFLMYLDEFNVTSLVKHSLFMMYEMSTTQLDQFSQSIKTFGVHSSVWHLCKREAGKNKSFHVLSSRKDGLSEDMKSQRRLSIHNNVLFAIKDVHNSMEDEHCSSSARSLGCYGPYHPYQVPITFGLRLLRLLDALTIRLYEFPIQLLKLVLLRYLALTYNGILPGSISKLWNLQFLIVRQHLRIIRSSSYLPMEIWDMKELKHLQVTGSDLPDPSPFGAFLPNLSTLLDVSGDTCTKGVLQRLPHLKKLGLRIELRPDGDELFTWLAHISCLVTLAIFKCVIVNPVHRPEIVTSPTPLPNFLFHLQKLTLSGLCYPWEEMSKLAKIYCLKVLKLRNYAFRGPEWHMKEDSFKNLSLLLIEDTDLVHWTVARGSFSDCYSSIRLKHCYKLEEIQWRTHILPRNIQVVDCNPLILPCWKKIITECSPNSRKRVDVEAHFSWMDNSKKQGFRYISTSFGEGEFEYF